MRILYMGTPLISVPFLELLVELEEVVGVVTQEDKPSGRGYRLKFPPIKECALKYNLPVFQPTKIKTNEFFEKISMLHPDLIVVVAYGKILPKEILSLPSYGSINIHFSLLPKYRGPSPVQWAIIKGEKITGITTMFMDEGVDTGEIILQKEVIIRDNDDVLSLRGTLIQEGCKILEETVKLIKQKKVKSFPQKGEDSYAPLLKKENGKIYWEKSAYEIYNLIRGTRPWPGTYTITGENEGNRKILKIIEAYPLTLESNICHSLMVDFIPGQIVEIRKQKGAVVKCGKGFLLVSKVHPEGKKVMGCYDYLQGKRLRVGDYLS